MKKGIIFAGCSFTWGQGLYYYSGMETLKEPAPEQYEHKLVKDAHKRFMWTLRFPRLVANHFNTFEIVKKENGGSEDESLKFIDYCFNDEKNQTHLIEEKFSREEIGYIIYQTTQPGRSSFDFTHKGHTYRMNWIGSSQSIQKIFFEWMQENGIVGFPEWYVEHCKQQVKRIKEVFEHYESKGIKCLILNWQDDYVKYVTEDTFMHDRMIYLNYNDSEYTNIDYMIRLNNGLTIKDDFHNLGESPPQDSHPSKKCHKIIADAVIKKIESL